MIFHGIHYVQLCKALINKKVSRCNYVNTYQQIYTFKPIGLRHTLAKRYFLKWTGHFNIVIEFETDFLEFQMKFFLKDTRYDSTSHFLLSTRCSKICLDCNWTTCPYLKEIKVKWNYNSLYWNTQQLSYIDKHLIIRRR